jgi:serine/threonine protein kinase
MSRPHQLIDLLQRWDEEEQAGRPASATSVCGDRTDLVAELHDIRDFQGRLERLMGSLESLETVVRAAGDTVAPPGLPSPPGYAVSQMLAEGGMGQVYRARHLRLGREVALKVIRPDRVSADLLARFQTEAEAVARLDDPNIVQIYEVGEYAEGELKIPFLALEFVPGGTLESRVGTSPMPPAEAARVVRLLARAVAHAHARGIVHRDLKPDNILIAPPADEPALNAALGRPKITDFGLARREVGGSSVTTPGSIMGTPSYMAPEQARGESAGPPADVYALGAILYRLLTGRVVFPRESWVDALHDVCHAAPRPPRELVPGIPLTLEALCLRCLEKDADDRPTAAELAAQLDRLSAPDPLTPTDLYRPPPRRRRSRRRLLIAALVAGLVLPSALLAWRLMPPKSPAPDAPPEPVRLVRIKGYLDAEMTRKDDRLRQGIPLSDPAARPLRPGDRIRVEAKLNRPTYVYLVWIDTAGEVTPMYPWLDGHWDRREPEEKAQEVQMPRLKGNWVFWPMGPGKPGLETMVLMCRDEPLPADVDLKGMLRNFGPQPFDGQDPHTIAWFERGATVRNEPTRAPLTTPVEGTDPLERINAEIHKRVKGVFRYTRAITYGNEGDRP